MFYKLKMLKIVLLLAGIVIVVTSCSFDYGNNQAASKDQPDIVMQNVEYVRVRGGDPVVRFQAEGAERYEEKQTMDLHNFSFEQFENHGDEIDAVGSAGQASVALDTGNISLGQGVIISVESEDITIETYGLDWLDKERRLLGTSSGEVNINRSDGTKFSGRGFSADARSRTWTFTSGVSGSYVEKDEDEDEDEEVSEEATEEAEAQDIEIQSETEENLAGEDNQPL